MGAGRLTGMSDASSTAAFVYDARGNVLSETRVISGNSYTVAYTYDAADKVASITYPSGCRAHVLGDAGSSLTPELRCFPERAEGLRIGNVVELRGAAVAKLARGQASLQPPALYRPGKASNRPSNLAAGMGSADSFARL
ncbi:MAG: RHS repeat domain-containing protein [Hyphomicrobiales bacterium]